MVRRTTSLGTHAPDDVSVAQVTIQSSVMPHDGIQVRSHPGVVEQTPPVCEHDPMLSHRLSGTPSQL